MIESAQILVVDDEQHIRFFLTNLLKRDGHLVHEASDGNEALAIVKQHEFDLILLDLNLGTKISGIDILEQVHKQWPHTIVIILTAQGSMETAVSAVRHGAHDYLFKPCHAEELRQSIKKGLTKRAQTRQKTNILDELEKNLASLRTLQGKTKPLPPLQTPSEEITPAEILTYGGLSLHLSSHYATIDGQAINLSPIEFDLLAYLLQQQPRAVSAQELLTQIHGYEGEVWEARDVVRTHIYRIRQKLKPLTNHDPIRTVRGIGYAIQEDQ